MKHTIIYLTTLAMLTTACSQTKKIDEGPVGKGIDVANMDNTIMPGNDFYRYSCGGWIDAHPLKPEYSRFGTFDQLNETSQDQVKSLIEELENKQNEPGSNSQKISDLYAMAMDTARRNEEKAQPLKTYLKSIEDLKDKSEISTLVASMFRDGTKPFFDCYVYADDKNSDINIFHLSQGGFSMGDRDYYLQNDDRSKVLRSKYSALIEKLFALSGYTPEKSKEASSAILKIETRLAKVAYSRVDLRDPQLNYHKITIEELREKSPEIDWTAFFNELGLTEIKDLNLLQQQPVAEVSKIIKETSMQDIKYYLSWNVINGSASCLSEDFINASFDYYGKALSGKEELMPLWKRSVSRINSVLGEAVGQVYVEKYFPPAAKDRMIDLVNNLQVSLGERIGNLSWMGPETKEKAKEKLATFHVKIGYPDKWRDYSTLKIDTNDSYLDNTIRSNNFEFDYMISKFNQPVDKDEWLMNPQEVNAYYNPQTNEICFPAAILQPPFFNMEADDAVNYGAIGVVIGHEMTHGFDDQGRMYDKNGNMADWWTTDDAKKFDERAKVLVDFFNNIIVLDTIRANGKLTLGENIADQGGLQVSWQAYQNSLKGKEKPAPIAGFTDSQRFFLGYATVWAGNIRDEEILRLTKIDPHSLGKWRVNAALPQVDAWYDAFNVKETDKLFVPKEQRVSIW